MDYEQEIQGEVKANMEILDTVSGISVRNEDDIILVSDNLVTIKRRHNALEDKRKEIAQPINKSLKAINDLFGKATGPLALAEQAIKEKVVEWYSAELVRIDKEEIRRRKIQDAHAAKGHNVELPAYIDRPDKTIGSINISTRSMKISLEDATKVPDEFKVLVVDLAKVEDAIREGLSVPGIKVEPKLVVSVKTK